MEDKDPNPKKFLKARLYRTEYMKQNNCQVNECSNEQVWIDFIKYKNKVLIHGWKLYREVEEDVVWDPEQAKLKTGQ